MDDLRERVTARATERANVLAEIDDALELIAAWMSGRLDLFEDYDGWQIARAGTGGCRTPTEAIFAAARRAEAEAKVVRP